MIVIRDNRKGFVMITKINVAGMEFEAVNVATGHSNVLLIQAGAGFLGCGYFRIDVADKLEDPVAIVRGVTNPAEMLEAKVEEISRAAEKAGVRIGMSGCEALLRLAGGVRPSAKR